MPCQYCKCTACHLGQYPNNTVAECTDETWICYICYEYDSQSTGAPPRPTLKTGVWIDLLDATIELSIPRANS